MNPVDLFSSHPASLRWLRVPGAALPELQQAARAAGWKVHSARPLYERRNPLAALAVAAAAQANDASKRLLMWLADAASVPKPPLDGQAMRESAFADLIAWFGERREPWLWTLEEAGRLDFTTRAFLDALARQQLATPAIVAFSGPAAWPADDVAATEAPAAEPPTDANELRVWATLSHLEGWVPAAAFASFEPAVAALTARGLIASDGGALRAVASAPEGLETLDVSNRLESLSVDWALHERAATDAAKRSFAAELLADALYRAGEVTAGRAALARAVEAAQGVRRLALSRRIAEEQAVAGDVDLALATLAQVGYVSPAVRTGEVPKSVSAARAASLPGVLDRWETLTFSEGQIALELARAEALSMKAAVDEAKAAFLSVESRLALLWGEAAAHLWLRWARTWVWFLGETLGKPREAMQVCIQVRGRVGPDALKRTGNAASYVRAEQIAASRAGELVRSLELAREQLALAREAGDVREECIGLNSAAILEMSQGNLAAAAESFEQSRALGKRTGYKRREAIALHNLGLVQCELGQLDAAAESQTEYVALSGPIGNSVAQGYGPMSLAVVDVARGELQRAEHRVDAALQLSRKNGWAFLVSWGRAITGQARLLQWRKAKDSLLLARARSDLLGCLVEIESKGVGWTEEMDPGEVYAMMIAAHAHSSDAAGVAASLLRAEKHLPPDAVVSKAWVAVAKRLAEKQSLEPALAWFADRGFGRALGIWALLA